MKYTKPKFKTVDRVRVSKNDIPFQKEYKPQCTDDFFEISAISTKKNKKKRKNFLHTSSKISKKKKCWKNFMRNS